MPKVSVCIPVYGVENYIERCARSLFEQTLDDIEFIFVDDCSPDRSIEILKHVIDEYRHSFEKRNYTVRIEQMPTNSGLAAVRRHGIQLATGDYITFCDSDDTIPQYAIETLYNAALESRADIVSGDMEWIFDDGSKKCIPISLPHGSDPESVYRALLHKEYSHTLCSKLFSNGLLNGFEYTTLLHATNGEDGMLFYQVLQHAKKVVHINKIIYGYYQNNQSSTHVRFKTNALNSIIQLNKIRLNTCGKIESLKDDTWVYVSSVLNELVGDGYNKDGTLKRIIHKEGMDEFINPFRMFLHYPFNTYVRTIIRRIIKPLFIRS